MMTITIDGPAAAGKSTLARALADDLGLVYLNSGSIYRAAALCNPQQSRRLHLPEVAFDAAGRVLVDGADREDEIRSPRVAMDASTLSARPEVRAWVNDMLAREAARHDGVVAEGRDMGTAVFPHADVKVYLDAEPETRAWRRYAQHPEQSYNDVLRDLERRDEQDSTRECSPLRKADDALVIDNTCLTVGQTVGIIRARIRREGAHGGAQGS